MLLRTVNLLLTCYRNLWKFVTMPNEKTEIVKLHSRPRRNPLPLESRQERGLRLTSLHGVAGPASKLKVAKVVAPATLTRYWSRIRRRRREGSEPWSKT